MKWLSTFCKKCVAKLWMVGIVLLVLVALIVSAIRGALPYVNEYQAQVTEHLKSQYDIHLAMGAVKGYWYDGGPLLVVDDLHFNNRAQLGVDVSASQIKLHVDVIDSVLALAPRFKQIEIVSPRVLIDELPTSDPNQNTDIDYLIAMVQSAVITDASVSFSSYYGQLPDIDIARIAWYDAIDRRQLHVLLTDQAKRVQPLKLIVDLQGESGDPLRGQLYVKAQQWRWLENLKPMLPQLHKDATAQASFEIWADFSVNQLDSMIVQLGENVISWPQAEEVQHLSFSQELIQWLPYQQGWVFESKSLTPVLNNKSLAPLDIFMVQSPTQLSLNIPQFDFSDWSALAGLLSAVNNETVSLLNELVLSGQLKNIRASHDSRGWSYQGQLRDFSMKNVEAIPSIDDLDGEFSGHNGSGQLTVSADKQQFDFGEYFKAPIAVEHLTSDIMWHLQDNQLLVSSAETIFTNKDATANISWQLDFGGADGVVLSLLGDAAFSDAKQTQYYLPHVVLSDDLVSYLSDAIKSGRSNNVELLWQGALAKFPYGDRDGAFEITARVNDAAFEFDDEWAPLTKGVVDLRFKNEAMIITGIEGKLANLGFDTLTTSIDDLMADSPVLAIRASVTDNQQQINDFVFSSPIDESVGPVLRQLDVTGDITTFLNIDIPLDDSLPEVSGKVRLKDNNLSVKAIDLDINALTGDVYFVGGDITANTLQGELYLQPVTLALVSKPVGDSYGIEVDLDAKWHTNKMPKLWQDYLSAYIDGSLDWQGKLTLKISDDDVYYQSFVKSPMKGLELKLPKPLDKYVDQQEDLLVTSSGNVAGGLFNLALGSRAEVFARIDSSQGDIKIPALTLLVGRKFKAQDDIATEGMTINIDLDTLGLGEWEAFIDSIERGQSQDKFFPPLQRINARVKQLNVIGQTLDDVTLGGIRVDDYWQVDVNSQQAKGQLKLYDNWFKQGLTADFSELSLSESQTSGVGNETTLDTLRNLPPLNFTCQQCDILGRHLGSISFNTKPHLQGMSINDILVKAGESEFNAKAIWGFDSQGQYSTIEGKLTSENIESTLAVFDYTSSIRESDVEVDINVMWRSAIHDLDLPSLDGSVKWKLGEGHIAEVSDQGARIFSLFSLDSLRRKLVLDFRDVFQKGIFYNNFKGNFDINKGIAVTRDAHMDGVAGGVDVVGSVNLTTHELDYYISFSPALFSNLPVIAGVVASEPQMFVLTFALTKVLEPIVDVISEVNFKLSGTIDEPNFVEVDRKQKKYNVPPHILEKSAPKSAEEPPIEGAQLADEQGQTDSSTTGI